MKTKFNEIVNVSEIGKEVNSIKMNDILAQANKENLLPASKDSERVMFIGIDYQQDFMDEGALGVPGANKDVENVTKWMYENMENISQIAVSLDTHNPFQIFHPAWWIDVDGNNPAPFTAITLSDIDDGKWRAVVNPIGSRNYVENLEKEGKKVLVIWTYHTLQGTSGCALENQFANIIYFHSVAKKSMVQRLVKGSDPMSEMYGIIKPEYDTKNYINLDFLNKIENFDKIVISGEAKSHCLGESIRQILEYYENKPQVTSKIYVLEDCTSPIPSFEDETKRMYDSFKSKYNINIVDSKSFIL